MYLPSYLSSYLPIFLPFYLSTFLPAFLATFLPTFRPIPTCRYLPADTYLSTYLPIFRFRRVVHMYDVPMCVILIIYWQQVLLGKRKAMRSLLTSQSETRFLSNARISSETCSYSSLYFSSIHRSADSVTVKTNTVSVTALWMWVIDGL